MSEYNLDVLIATDPQTLKYFGYDMWMATSKEWMFKSGGTMATGINNFCIIPCKKKPIYVLEASSISFLKDFEVKDVIGYGIFTDINKVLKKDLCKNTIDIAINKIFKNGISNNIIEALDISLVKYNLKNSKIGIEEVGISPKLLEDIKKNFSHCSFRDSSEFFRIIRMIKTPEELEFIKKSSKINETAIINSIKELSTQKLFGKIKNKFKEVVDAENSEMEHYVIFPNGIGVVGDESYIIGYETIIGLDTL